jgi:hypothetical protein
MTAIPVTRTLTAVLRDALDTEPGVRLLVGQFGAADPSNAYCNVVLQGQTLRVPMLAGVTDTQGKPAYLLATKDLILCIGSVTP